MNIRENDIKEKEDLSMVRSITHSLKLVDYLSVQAGQPFCMSRAELPQNCQKLSNRSFSFGLATFRCIKRPRSFTKLEYLYQ